MKLRLSSEPFLAKTRTCQNFRSRVSKVKFDFSTVRTRVIPILKRVEVEDYPAKIGRIYGWSRQHVYYYIKKLEKLFSAFQNTFFSDKEPALRKEELE